MLIVYLTYIMTTVLLILHLYIESRFATLKTAVANIVYLYHGAL